MPNAIITGGGSKIGLEISNFLFKKGYKIIAHYCSSESKLEALKSKGIIIDYIQGNFLYKDEIRNLVNNVLFKFNNQIDLVINNAAIFKRDNARNIDYSILAKSCNINVYAPIMISQLLHRYNAKPAQVINILDYSVQTYPLDFFSYNISKKLLEYASKVQAINYAPKTRINSIALSPITPSRTQVNFTRIASKNPMQQQIKIEELFETILFLEKVKNITGHTIFLDGGKNLYQDPYSI